MTNEKRARGGGRGSALTRDGRRWRRRRWGRVRDKGREKDGDREKVVDRGWDPG